jgi:hypothetical protein
MNKMPHLEQVAANYKTMDGVGFKSECGDEIHWPCCVSIPGAETHTQGVMLKANQHHGTPFVRQLTVEIVWHDHARDPHVQCDAE